MSQELHERIAQLELREVERERRRLTDRHKLPGEIGALIQGSTLQEMENHAQELQSAIHSNPAPPTENGAQPAATTGQAAAAEKPDYSFNIPGGVAW